MALTQYDIAFMTDQEEALIKMFTQQWEAAKVIGDTAAMERAHQGAEMIRAKYAYSGGEWGNQYIALGTQVAKENAESTPKGNTTVADPYYAANHSTTDTPNGNYTSNVGESVPAFELPAGFQTAGKYALFALLGLAAIKLFTR